jgi:hypothetical protein
MDIKTLEQEFQEKEAILRSSQESVLAQVRPLEETLENIKKEADVQIEAAQITALEAVAACDRLAEEYQEKIAKAAEELEQARSLHSAPLDEVQAARDMALKAWKDAHIPDDLKTEHAFCKCGEPMSTRRTLVKRFSTKDGTPEPSTDVWIWMCDTGIEGHDSFTV